MDGLLRQAMSKFAVDAKFVSVELHEWSHGSETCRHTCLPLAQAYERVLEWFAEKLQKALEEEMEEELQLLRAVLEIQEKESAAVASQEVGNPFIPRCFTLHPDLLREFRRNRKPQVCRNRYKPGHLVKYCPDILPTKYGLRPARQV